MRTTMRIFSIFNSAAMHFVQQEDLVHTSPTPLIRSALTREEWALAVIKGANDRSPRWRHICVLAGLLIGFEAKGQQGVSHSLRKTLEKATVRAINLALREGEASTEFPANSIVMMLSHVFDLLNDGEKMDLDHDLLLPILYHAPLFAREGLHSGYFLSTIDPDVLQSTNEKFDWSANSATYIQCQYMATGPLITSLGAISRLIAFSAERVKNVDLLSTMIKDMMAFSRTLCVQWQQNKMSEIDVAEDSLFLSDDTLRTTLPLLWRVLKSTMFAIVIVLRSLLGRVLGTLSMQTNSALFVAIQTLHILRNLYFISCRVGAGSANIFSQYTFVYLTAIDIVSQYPVQAEAFLHEIRPTSAQSIPPHPLDRCLDLYFLNTGEHFAITLSPKLNETLLIGAAQPYLGLGGDQRLFEMFEAAHSVMLAVLSAHQNADLLVRHIHPYVDALFKVFPQNVSARQFRVGMKTLIRITSPPAPISEHQPLLPSTLLELIRYRLETASPELIRQPLESGTLESLTSGGDGLEYLLLSEVSVLLLTLIDALPFLPIDQLGDWLPLIAGSLNVVKDSNQLQICKQRFWDVLSKGEMDVNRATHCVAWWGTKGGKDMMVHGTDQPENGAFMSGGLQEVSKL